MKKSLVALAVLAASGASFAQVSVTGALGFSYQKNAVPAGGAANHGMVMSDGNLKFAATEDLGAGMKITAATSFNAKGRSSTIDARDASLTLATSAATFVLGAIERCGRIDNVAGAPVSLASAHDSGDGGPLAYGTFALDGTCANVDTAGASFGMGPLSLAASYNEVGGNSGAGTAPVHASYYLLSADYASGPFALGLEYRTAKANSAGVAFASGTYHDGLATTSLSGSYDMGMLKVGAGMQVANHNTPSQYTLSVAAPVGDKVTVGLVYSNRASVTADAAYFDTSVDSVSGTGIGMNYALGKMTTLNASYSTYSGAETKMGNEYRIRLLKSF